MQKPCRNVVLSVLEYIKTLHIARREICIRILMQLATLQLFKYLAFHNIPLGIQIGLLGVEYVHLIPLHQQS